MLYSEVFKDIFTIDKKYALGHCISLDCEIGEDITTEFNKILKVQEDHC